jgi:hypothetical protein
MSIIKIVNSSTGEEIEREMTAAELKVAESQAKAWDALQTELATKAADKAAVLAKLGLTENEVAALFG